MSKIFKCKMKWNVGSKYCYCCLCKDLWLLCIIFLLRILFFQNIHVKIYIVLCKLFCLLCIQNVRVMFFYHYQTKSIFGTWRRLKISTWHEIINYMKSSAINEDSQFKKIKLASIGLVATVKYMIFAIFIEFPNVDRVEYLAI